MVTGLITGAGAIPYHAAHECFLCFTSRLAVALVG